MSKIILKSIFITGCCFVFSLFSEIRCMEGKDINYEKKIDDLRNKQIVIHEKSVAFMAFGIDEMPKHIKKLHNYNMKYKTFLKFLGEMTEYYKNARNNLDDFLIAFDIERNTLGNLHVDYCSIITALKEKIKWIEQQDETENLMNKLRSDYDPDERNDVEGVNLTDEGEPDELIKRLIASKKEYMKKATIPQ